MYDIDSAENPPTANERFKGRSNDWTALGIVLATSLHAALFVVFPTLTAEDIDFTGDEIEAVELPPEVRIPPPPQEIARPATPRVARVPIDDETTIARTDFESNPIENLPPPPIGARPSDVPSYIPRDVEPRLMNAAELIKLAQNRFPSALRQAGVSGTVGVFLFVSEKGEVTKAEVHDSSGYERLDKVALDVARAGDFEPAMIRDLPVGVWILLPISFSAG